MADGQFRSHLGSAADMDPTEIWGGHEHFDPQRIDLCEGEDWALVISIFTRNEKSLDHDAIDRATQCALVQNLFGVRDFQASKLLVELSLLELLFGNLHLRLSFLE